MHILTTIKVYSDVKFFITINILKRPIKNIIKLNGALLEVINYEGYYYTLNLKVFTMIKKVLSQQIY